MRRGKPPALPRRRCEAAIARCRGTRSDYTGDYNRNYLTGGVPRASTRTPRGNGGYYREEQEHAGPQKQQTLDPRKTARAPAVESPPLPNAREPIRDPIPVETKVERCPGQYA